MEDSVAVAVQPAEVIPNDSSVQPRNQCPLCNAQIRLFFIDFNEKMLMCENLECDFPFGHEQLQFFREDNDVLPYEELMSLQSKGSGVSKTAISVISTAAWSEIDRLHKTLESENAQFESQSLFRQSKKDSAKKIENDQLANDLRDIIEMNKQLSLDEQVPKVNIKNQKWIRNLQTLQEVSGVQLLNKVEMGLLKKKEEPFLGTGELKIDINPGDETCLSTIKIEIHNAGASTSKCKALNDIPT